MTETSQPASVPARLPLVTVLAPFALVFALGNYFRFMNAVLAPHLVADLHLSAGDLGLLVSAYFLASALFQAPLGLMMDRYGPRRVQASMILLGGIGALVFGAAATWPVALIGRVVMGLGAAGALMTSIQAVTLWFPTERWPFFNGIVLSVGALGALAATLPTQFVIDLLGWRQLMVGVALAAFAGGLMLFAVVPERVAEEKPSSLGEQLRGLGEVYRDRVFWRVAPLYMTTVGSTIAFQSLWAGTWLRDVAALDPNAVASDLLILTLMQIVAYVLNGLVASELNRRGVALIRIVIVGSALYVLSQTPLVLGSGVGRWVVLLGMGLLSNVNTLCYPMLSQHFPARLIGRANTALNTFFFIGAFILQYMVGLVIDLFPSEASGGYPVLAYQLAFAVTLAAQLASWAWLLVTPRPRSSEPS
ncbi:MAG TPA: MFS transporter [Stellaceae bacterium]|nr:MFS transporter [Stellaceae bacterium]